MLFFGKVCSAAGHLLRVLAALAAALNLDPPPHYLHVSNVYPRRHSSGPHPPGPLTTAACRCWRSAPCPTPGCPTRCSTLSDSRSLQPQRTLLRIRSNLQSRTHLIWYRGLVLSNLGSICCHRQVLKINRRLSKLLRKLFTFFKIKIRNNTMVDSDAPGI